LTQCVSDLTNLLVGDSYTDKAIIEAESFQVPVASREQYGSFVLDQGSEAARSDISSSSKFDTAKASSRKSSAASLFKTRKSTPSKELPSSTRKAPASTPKCDAMKNLFGRTPTKPSGKKPAAKDTDEKK